jgi:hypothetical protein
VFIGERRLTWLCSECVKMTVREINSPPKNKSLEEQYRDLLELREVVQKAVAKSNRAPSPSEPEDRDRD